MLRVIWQYILIIMLLHVQITKTATSKGWLPETKSVAEPSPSREHTIISLTLRIPPPPPPPSVKGVCECVYYKECERVC